MKGEGKTSDLSEEAMLLIGGLSAAVKDYDKKGGSMGADDLIAFTFAFYRGAEAAEVITRGDGKLTLAGVAQAAKAMLDGIKLKKPTVKSLIPDESTMDRGTSRATQRYLSAKPADASQLLSFEIMGFVEAMKVMGAKGRETYDVIAELVRRLRKSE